MEPAGLAIGILGLAGLFNSCLDIVERFGSWKAYGSDSQALAAQFEAEKLRFQKWGQSVGFVEGKLSADHHVALDDPRTLATVNNLLSVIRDSYSDGDDSIAPPAAGEEERSIKHGHFSKSKDQTRIDLKRQKLAWALRYKAKRTSQVEQFDVIVQNLHNLVSPDRPTYGNASVVGPPSRDGLVRLDECSVERDSWAEFRRILATIGQEIEAEVRRDLHAWLVGGHTSNEPYDNAIQRRVDGTCDWILSHVTFTDWLSHPFPVGTAKILWINRPAGFGKTVLCARVVEYLSSTLLTPVAYFFFSSDFETRKDPYFAIRSWISQVSMRSSLAFDLARESWEAQTNKRMTRSEALRVFRSITQAIPECTSILDGLDECALTDDWSIDDTCPVAEFLNAIQQAVAGTATRIMVVSRDEPEIRQGIFGRACVSQTEHKITPEDVQSDAIIFSENIVERKLANKDKFTRIDISRRLASRCQGQFLWLKMQEPCLRSGKNKKQLELAIDNTPMGIQHLYDRNWRRILALPDNERSRAISLLRWAAFAIRPLTVCEVTEALLIDDIGDLLVDEMPDDIDEEYIGSEILGLCGSLVEIRSTSAESEVGLRTVHLTHFSVKQYFVYRMSDRGAVLSMNEQLRSSHDASHSSVLARSCLNYIIIRNRWETREAGSAGSANSATGSFWEYAARFWHQHGNMATPTDTIVVRLTNELFDTRNPNWHSWKRWFDSMEGDQTDAEVGIRPTTSTPLHYAALLGLEETTNYLLRQQRYNANETSSSGRRVLEVACAKGHVKVANELLQAGAEVVHVGDDGWTPLKAASTNGHVEVVNLLLDNGADVAVADSNGWTPLNAASTNGHVEVVKVLLDNGADVAAADNDGWTPLKAASTNGHVEVVNLLLDNGADVAVADNNGWTPLGAASTNGHVEVVKILLDNGANVDVADKDNHTPLNVACFTGRVEVVRLLLDRGADATITENHDWLPLNVACFTGNVEVVKLLLDHGADVTIADKYGLPPLNIACCIGQVEVIRLLLSNGAGIAVTDNNGRTPLMAASTNGHVGIARVLLDNGADVAVADNNGRTPLMAASTNGHVGIAKVLLDNGADVAVRNKKGWTPLKAACSNGHAEVTKLLLENGADVTVVDEYGQTPLMAASANGNIEMVKLLLNHGADVATADKKGLPLLRAACGNGHTEVTKLLLENGADVAVVDEYGWTPLMAASANGHVEVAKVLLDNGADIAVRNKKGWTPLKAARGNGHVEVVKLLLNNGADIAVPNKNRWTTEAASGNERVEGVRGGNRERSPSPEIWELLLATMTPSPLPHGNRERNLSPEGRETLLTISRSRAETRPRAMSKKLSKAWEAYRDAR